MIRAHTQTHTHTHTQTYTHTYSQVQAYIIMYIHKVKFAFQEPVQNRHIQTDTDTVGLYIIFIAKQITAKIKKL